MSFVVPGDATRPARRSMVCRGSMRCSSYITTLIIWTFPPSHVSANATARRCDPARATNDRNHALWASFGVRGGNSVYFAGDTGFGGGRRFQAIAARHRGLDVALLPISADEPRWFMAPDHMNPEEAVRAFRVLKAKSALGYHWGSFRLSDEGVDEPP